MRRSFVRGCGLFLAALALPVFVVGSATAATKPAKVTKLQPATLNGSGSTLQLAYDQVVIGDFRKLQKAVTINYGGGGSGKGRQDFIDQVVDWAGTDAPFPAADATKPKGGAYLYFPTVADPITVSYNLSGVSNLQLSAETIAGIFSRTITKWDDAKIAADNPGVKLPSTAITVARRADSSGTTQNFATFLTKAAPAVWTLGSGSTVNWPSDTQGATGNTGVGADRAEDRRRHRLRRLLGRPGDRPHLRQGEERRRQVHRAVDCVGVARGRERDREPGPHLRPDQHRGPEGVPDHLADVHPRVQNQTDANKGNALVGFLNYIYGAGQVTAPTVDYAPLSKDLLDAGQGAGQQDRRPGRLSQHRAADRGTGDRLSRDLASHVASARA